MTASRVEPRNANAVAFFHMLDAATDCRNETDAFVTWDKWRIGFYRPVAFGGVEIGVTYARSLNCYLNLAIAGHWDRHFVDGQWFAEFANHGSLHCFSHYENILLFYAHLTQKPLRTFWDAALFLRASYPKNRFALFGMRCNGPDWQARSPADPTLSWEETAGETTSD
jgi:hypothetical protein